MNIEHTPIEGVELITPVVHRDERGFFMETYRMDEFSRLGLDCPFVQDSHSHSRRGVVRGLHFQWDPPMAKLVRVARGEVFFVVADIRKKSSTFRQWFGTRLSDENAREIFLPSGCAAGFAVFSDVADVLYKHTSVHTPGSAGGILWNDPTLAIDWPVTDPLLSPKDQVAPTLEEWLLRPESDLL